MAGFRELTDELLLVIASCLALCSILQFFLNKHIYELCKPVLSEYQALHREWGRVCIPILWNRPIMMILGKLLDGTGISWYIWELDTNCIKGQNSPRYFKGIEADEDGQDWDYHVRSLQYSTVLWPRGFAKDG
jgi:hypothetical protein